MTKKPNRADFSRAEYPGEFYTDIRLEGTMRVHIKAANKAEAYDQAEALCNRIAAGDADFKPDEIMDVAVDSVWARLPMFRVIRGGQKMQVSRLTPGDEPREADERGF